MTDHRIRYFKSSDRIVLDTHLNGMDTCLIPSCTNYKAEDFPLCPQHIYSAWHFHETQNPRENIPNSVKARDQAKQRTDLQHFLNGEPLEHAPGHIYILETDGLIKIGYSASVNQRLRHYPPSATVHVVFPGNPLIEKHLHTQHKEALTRGREWFTPTTELEEQISNLVAQHGAPPKRLSTDRFKKALTPQEKQAQTKRTARTLPKPLDYMSPSTRAAILDQGGYKRL